MASGYIAILLAIPPFGFWGSLLVTMPPLLATMWYARAYKESSEAKQKEAYTKSFWWMLAFAGMIGLTIGPVVGLIATTVPNGVFIVSAAFFITAVQVLGLSAYAYYKANWSQHDITTIGSFLSMALPGLLFMGLLCAIFPAPGAIVGYSILGNMLFSLYLVYDIQMVKSGGYTSPQIAAVNIFLDIVNMFLDMLMLLAALNSKSKDNSAGQVISRIFFTRIVPIVLVVGVILSFGMFEKSLFGPNEFDESAGHGGGRNNGLGNDNPSPSSNNNHRSNSDSHNDRVYNVNGGGARVVQYPRYQDPPEGPNNSNNDTSGKDDGYNYDFS